MRVFGQVNVSIDGLGASDVFRGGAGFESADRALELLVDAGVDVMVAGTAVFGRPDRAAAIRALRKGA